MSTTSGLEASSKLVHVALKCARKILYSINCNFSKGSIKILQVLGVGYPLHNKEKIYTNTFAIAMLARIFICGGWFKLQSFPIKACSTTRLFYVSPRTKIQKIDVGRTRRPWNCTTLAIGCMEFFSFFRERNSSPKFVKVILNQRVICI